MLLTHLWPLAWSQVLPDELNLKCESEQGRRYERELRQRIWTVENLVDDTVVEPVVRYPHNVNIQPYPGFNLKKVYAKDDLAHTGAAAFPPGGGPEIGYR